MFTCSSQLGAFILPVSEFDHYVGSGAGPCICQPELLTAPGNVTVLNLAHLNNSLLILEWVIWALNTADAGHPKPMHSESRANHCYLKLHFPKSPAHSVAARRRCTTAALRSLKSSRSLR